MASLAAQLEAVPAAGAATPFRRRLESEWALLRELAALNPDRLSVPAASDCAFHVELLGTPALSLFGSQADGRVVTTHRLVLRFPRFFPAVPMELTLRTPVFHPNVHPETGFVCLWDRHLATNTTEHALHKTAAILGWTLSSADSRHAMQPRALALSAEEREALRTRLYAPVLQGVAAPQLPIVPGFRRRLS